MNKKEKFFLSILITLFIVLALIFIFSDNLFGSRVDWLAQHTAFPEYFRNEFYETGNLLPNLALHIGSGQNIFNFAYYGLLNPIILISYLLPFIEMIDYIMISSFICICISTLLFYKWLKDKVNLNIRFIGTLLYFFAAPLIFHFHRHIMFVNYMPFLILGLIGVDKYIKDNKSLLLIISTFLMIMTSYYYSIGGLLCIVLYYFYNLLKKPFNIKLYLKEIIKFIIPIILSILLAAFFLIPTALCLLSGRTDNTSISLLSLFIPNFNLDNLIYSSYSLGVGSIFILALIYFIFNKNKEKKIISILIALICFIPIFVYVLNGTLYVRTKVLIPLLPLAILIISLFIEQVKNDNITKKLLYIIGIILLIIYISGYHNILFYIELLFIIFIIYLYQKKKKDIYLLPIIIISLILCIDTNKEDLYVSKSYSDKEIKALINSIDDDSFYRTLSLEDALYTSNRIYSNNHYQISLYSSVYNPYYYDFYYNDVDQAFPHRNKLIQSSSDNLLLQMYLGVKYIVSDKEMLGYDLLKEGNKYNLYKNNNVLNIGYGSSNLIGSETYKEINYPYNLEILLNYIITDTDNKEYKSNINKINLDGNLKLNNNVSLTKEEDKYIIDVSKNTNISYALDKEINNKIIMIDFNLENEQSCSIGDQVIKINGIGNKQTCRSWPYKNNNSHFTYVIADKTLNKLDIKIDKGKYIINNINIYELDYSNLNNIKDNKYNLENINIKTDYISGSVNMEEDGYFIFTIPYDTGFNVLVDGEKREIVKVNNNFIGFKLEKGSHKIELTYNSKGLKEGKIISIIALILTITYLIYQKKTK